MKDRKADLLWLGAEALPGDLVEINRVNQAWLKALARNPRSVREFQPPGFIATAMCWIRNRSSANW